MLNVFTHKIKGEPILMNSDLAKFIQVTSFQWFDKIGMAGKRNKEQKGPRIFEILGNAGAWDPCLYC